MRGREGMEKREEESVAGEKRTKRMETLAFLISLFVELVVNLIYQISYDFDCNCDYDSYCSYNCDYDCDCVSASRVVWY